MVGDDSRSCSSSVVPGAITALLREAFRSPQPTGGGISGFQPGVVVGRFELVRKLGRGGFGVVFHALDRTLGRAVAFKAVRPIGDVDVNAEMLLREAEAAAQLSHPNIVVLHDVGRCEHGPYLVMELLRGKTLAERLAEGAIPVAETLHVALEIAKGVAHAHARGVVHRDLKPANVFLCDEGQVKVLDFGMARIFGRSKPDGGTLAYMAPEQRRGEPEDERTDVFALGVILREMLGGKRPDPDAGALACEERAPALDVPGTRHVAELAARMLALDPAGRPRNGLEVLAALQAAEREWRGRAAAAGAERRPSVRWAALGVAAAAAVALVVLVGRAGPRAASLPVPAPAPPGPPATSPAALRTVAPASPEPRTANAAADPFTVPPERAAAPRSALAAAAPTRPAKPAPRASVRYCLGSIDSVPTPRPESGDGVLVVVADPFADVYVDGRAYGETPSECVVSAGAHTVRASHSRYGSREARVEVKPGERARFTADFLTGQ